MDQEVLGLEIVVQHTVGVGVGQCGRRILCKSKNLIYWQWAFLKPI